jgi:hypothetical protein
VYREEQSEIDVAGGFYMLFGSGELIGQTNKYICFVMPSSILLPLEFPLCQNISSMILFMLIEQNVVMPRF